MNTWMSKRERLEAVAEGLEALGNLLIGAGHYGLNALRPVEGEDGSIKDTIVILQDLATVLKQSEILRQRIAVVCGQIDRSPSGDFDCMLH